MRRGRAAFVRGEELAAAVREMESHSGAERLVLVRGCLYTNSNTSSLCTGGRRAFSGITLPSIPFLPTSRALSPVSSISRHLHQAAEYNHLGHRRSSSAGAMSSPHYHQSRDEQWQWKLTRSPSNGIIPVSRSRHLAIYSFLSARKYTAGITV